MKKILLATIIFINAFSVGYAQCTKPTSVTITTPATISICEGTALTLSGSAVVNGTSQNGGFTYSWIKATPGMTVIVPPTTIAITSNANTPIPSFMLNSTVIADAGTYVLRVEDGNAGNSACYTEASVFVTVDPAVTTPIITGDQTICAGTTAVPIGGPETIGGPSTETSIYMWETSRTGGSGWITITGATSKDYAPGILMADDYYRRTDIKGSCSSATSNVIKITALTPVQISSDRSIICKGSPVLFTADAINGDPAPLYEWFINDISQGAPTSSPQFSTTDLTSSTDNVHVVLTSTTTGCNTSTNTYTTVTTGITAGIIGSDQTVCYNTTAYILETVAPTNIRSIPTYTWEISAVSAGAFTAISGATNSTLTSTPQITSDVYIRRIITDPSIPSPCNVATSNTIHITSLPQFFPGTIAGDETICEGSVATIPITNVEFESGGSGTINDGYTWLTSLDGSTNWYPITGATNAQYGFSSSPFTATRYYKRVANDYCNYLQLSSNIVVKTVITCDAFSSNISGPNPISPGQQNAVYSVPNQTGFTYMWSITGGTIISEQNTNSVTVDWDAATTNAFARTTSSSYSISVLEKNSTNQTKTTTATINTISTGTIQSQAQSGINVFPNPTTGSFNIEMPESGMNVTYEILDLTGLSVANGTFTSTGSDQRIDTNFGAGMYQVILKYNNVVTCVRLSKVR
jgi:hypothetical protein